MLKVGLVSNFLHKYQFTGNVLLFFKGFDHSFYDDLVLVPGIDHFVDQSIDAVFDNKSQNKSRKMIQALLQPELSNQVQHLLNFTYKWSRWWSCE